MLQLEDFMKIWRNIEAEYYCGRIVSERDLQAHLACLIRNRVSHMERVVVEPIWQIEGKRLIPDLVLTDVNTITDIFEIKFVPYAMADAKVDIAKLVKYASHEGLRLPVSIVPETGSWQKGVPLAPECRLHFVAISNNKTAAVWPESLRYEVSKLDAIPNNIIHWYGRVKKGLRNPEDWGLSILSAE